MTLMPTTRTGIVHLAERDPADLAAPRWSRPSCRRRSSTDATFDNYRADPLTPRSRRPKDTLMRLRRASRAAEARAGSSAARRRGPSVKPGVYLDGGFGVGKTHLLAALYHAMPARRKYFGSFIEYTALVGALGYKNTVELFRGADLLCIDEFELDDPGDTMVMTRLLGELVASGTRLAATSNTPPNALGEGRFAAQDFLREIHAMAASFETIRIDGTRLPPARARRARRGARAERATTSAIADAARARRRLRRRLRRPGRAPRARAPVALHPADRRARPSSDCATSRRSPTSPPRCASSRSSTACTTRRSRSAPPARRWTRSSATRCSPAATARSTCAPISRLIASTRS